MGLLKKAASRILASFPRSRIASTHPAKSGCGLPGQTFFNKPWQFKRSWLLGKLAVEIHIIQHSHSGFSLQAFFSSFHLEIRSLYFFHTPLLRFL